MSAAPWVATRTGRPAQYVVQNGERQEVVFVAGSAGQKWAFWNGRVYRTDARPGLKTGPYTSNVTGHGKGTTNAPLTAPMPATVLKVLVQPGAAVTKGQTVVVLEAMKMELPIRAPGALTVAQVHCREGDLVQPDTPLISFA
jgi:biotin carboxyl carrier protein